MDKKKLEEMLEPSAMKMFSETQARLASLSLATGSTDKLLKIAQDLNPSQRWAGHLATQDLLSKLSETSPQNNSIAEMIKSLTESNFLNTRVFESVKLNKSLIDVIEAVNLSLKPQTQFVLPKSITSGSQVGELGSITSKITEAFKQYEKFSRLESFKAISRLNDFQFEEIISTNLTQEDIASFSEKPISEIDSDLSDEIKSGDDFSLYSDKAKKLLVCFYHIYLLQFLLGIASGLATYYILQAQEESKTLTTQQEVRAFIRSPPATFDRNSLKGHRFTMVGNLNFRENPSMDSNSIEMLPIGTIVKIIDKSNRSWLLVEVEIDGELEQGWVLRRYTTYFK